jgi:mannose-6-phosphate isomerase-like protein (cupin superfamily)
MKVIADTDREPFRTRDGSLVRELCQRGDGARNQSLAEATVAPGAQTIEHLHRRSEEIYRFVSGAGRMRLGDEESEVRAGDTVLIAAGVRHRLVNPGPEPLVLLCCCSPAGMAPFRPYRTGTRQS